MVSIRERQVALSSPKLICSNTLIWLIKLSFIATIVYQYRYVKEYSKSSKHQLEHPGISRSINMINMELCKRSDCTNWKISRAVWNRTDYSFENKISSNMFQKWQKLMHSLPIKELKFIHITKNAGTSIEELGLKEGIQWGQYHFKERGTWHRPFPNNTKEFKSKYDWFFVVRNPYDRIISEYHCKWGGEGKGRIVKNAETFNDFIRQRMSERYTRTTNQYHYMEHSAYIDFRQKIHILRYENIESDFAALMRKYNINLKMTMNLNKFKKKRTYTKEDLDSETVAMIQEVYKDDFEWFGYNNDITAEV
mmetsp:Transcript_20667/g.25380  ORF Transcript_20667/g.25380 Transcript_20667/m.25380 type:complete len:308 (-) Transcript_20667:328-1251(-)